MIKCKKTGIYYRENDLKSLIEKLSTIQFPWSKEVFFSIRKSDINITGLEFKEGKHLICYNYKKSSYDTGGYEVEDLDSKIRSLRLSELGI